MSFNNITKKGKNAEDNTAYIYFYIIYYNSIYMTFEHINVKNRENKKTFFLLKSAKCINY